MHLTIIVGNNVIEIEIRHMDASASISTIGHNSYLLVADSVHGLKVARLAKSAAVGIGRNGQKG